MVEEKTSSFLTKSILKNESFANKGKDIASLNKSFNSFAISNVNALNNLNKNLTKVFGKLTLSQQSDNLVRKQDTNKKMINQLDDLNELMKENIKVNKGKHSGLFNTISGLVGKGLLSYLIFGNKEHLLKIFSNLFSFISKGGKGIFSAILSGDFSGIISGFKSGMDSLKQLGGGLVDLIRGDPSTLVKSFNDFKNKVPLDGLLGFFVHGDKAAGPFNKSLSVLFNTMKVPGGLFQGLVFGDWSLLKKSWGELENILPGGKFAAGGLVAALLFGKPIVAGLLGGFTRGLTESVTKSLISSMASAHAASIVKGATGLSPILAGLASPANVAILGAVAIALVAYAGVKMKGLWDAAADAKEIQKKTAQIQQEKVERRADLQNMSVADKTNVKSMQQTSNLLQADLNPLPSPASAVAASFGDFFLESPLHYATGGKFGSFSQKLYEPQFKEAEKMGLFEIETYKRMFAKDGWTPEAKRKTVEYVIQQNAMGIGNINKKYGPFNPTTYEMNSLDVFNPDQIPDNIINNGADLQNLNEQTRNDFYAMAREYGKPIQVNSGFRDFDKQLELFEKYPDKAVDPRVGKSRHQLGRAIDIQTKGDYGFTGWDLLSKYGFRRPIVTSEPWHVEHKTSGVVEVDSPEQGDAMIENLPSASIQNKIREQNNQGLDLSESTIKSLAIAIGSSFKNSWPKMSPNQISIDTNVRG